MLSQSCVAVVLGWQVYDFARKSMDVQQSAAQLGILGLIAFAPIALLSLYAGSVADRLDRRHIVASSMVLYLVCTGTLAWLTGAGALTLPIIFTIAALQGVARAFHLPAMSALGPSYVPPAVLPQAIAVSTLAGRFGAILGPVLGGSLFTISPTLPYCAALVLTATTLVCALVLDPPLRHAEPKNQRALARIAEGLAYVRNNRLLLGAISLDMFAVLLGGATALLPVFARDILHVGADGLGFLRAAPAVGAISIGLWFAHRPLRDHVGLILLLSVMVFGAATVVLGLAQSLPIALASLFVVGVSDMTSVYVRLSLIQLQTPDAMRGRVGSVSSLFVSASNELGEAESGFAAALFGPVTAIIGGGAGAIAIAFIWSRLFPQLRSTRTFGELS